MSDSGTSSGIGQVLGASTVAGGIEVLPYTGGSVLINILLLSIKISMVLVVVSVVASRLYLFLKRNHDQA